MKPTTTGSSSAATRRSHPASASVMMGSSNLSSSDHRASSSQIKKASFIGKLRWALLILALTMGTATFYMLEIAHTSALVGQQSSSHLSLSLLESRKTRNFVGGGGGGSGLESPDKEDDDDDDDKQEEEAENPESEELGGDGGPESPDDDKEDEDDDKGAADDDDDKDDDKQEQETENPESEKQPMSERNEANLKQAMDNQRKTAQKHDARSKDNNSPETDAENGAKELHLEKKPKNIFTNKQQQQKDLKEETGQHEHEQALRREAALREFEKNAPLVVNHNNDNDDKQGGIDHGQHGGEAAVAAGNPFDRDAMDGVSPAKVQAIKAALALDQSKREEAANEELEQERVLADANRKATVNIAVKKAGDAPKLALMAKQREQLWDLYADSVVQLESPQLRTKLDPLYIESIDTPIKDLYRVPFEPKVQYLGVLVDAGRHYFPISWWKQLIVYLYKLKFNLIQFRLTDDQTFNVRLKSYPKLATPVVLDYNKQEKKVYTPQELRDLVAFAKQYNISMVPEINVPGHAGAWAGVPDLIVMCPEFICRTGYGIPLNIQHPEIKTILKRVFSEIIDIFDNPPYFHAGGDEVNMADPCFAEVHKKPFNYTGFENDLKGIFRDIGYPEDQVIRWERTGQSISVERAGNVEHYWSSMPGYEFPMSRYPNGEYKPWFISRGLYFDVDHEDEAMAIYRYANGVYYQKNGVPPPTAIIAGTFELGTEFWLQRNVATRLIATVMGASRVSPSGFMETFNSTCHDLGIDGRWCNLQGNIATLLEDYQQEHRQTWSVWKDGICERLTERQMKLTQKDSKPARNSLESTGYEVFWESFGDEEPVSSLASGISDKQKSSEKMPLGEHSVPMTGVVFDMVNSLESPPSRVLELLRDFVAPLGFKTLQLRLVDDNGFAIRLKTQPKLGYTALTHMALSDIHDAGDYQELATSAMKELGIQIIPEITLSTNAGGWINTGFAANCPKTLCEKGKGIAIDVSSPGFLPVVYTVIRELRRVFGSTLFHLGHDDRQAALNGCLREGGKEEEELALFEEKLSALVGLLNISQDQIIRYENQEGKVYKDRTGKITQYKASGPTNLPKVKESGKPFFVTVDLLHQNPWSIYETTRALVKLSPTAILGEIRDVTEDAWEKKNVGLRLVAFAMGLQRTTDTDLDEKSFQKALVGACKASKISGCEKPDGTKEHLTFEVDQSRYHDKMCSEFTFNSMGRVPRKDIV